MRILAIANAHALAHVTRLLEIAKVLRMRGHAITFAGFGKYLDVAAADHFPVRELSYISVARIIEAVRTQKLWTLYPQPELERYVAAELALFETLRPDLVLLDNRPTARTSADIAGVPTAAVLNVHMSNYRRIPFFSYRQLAPWLPGGAALDRVENAIERQMYDRLVMRALNAIRKARGLPRRYAYEHEEGDISLFADVPDFNPADDLPPHAKYVGPLTWHNGLPESVCLSRLDGSKPIAYFSLGSAALEELVPRLGEFARHGIQVVVATGSDVATPDLTATGVYFERFVNADLLLAHCDVICCHGGNGTLYQALRHGVPCVVVSTHAEQHYGGKRIAELRLGRSFTLKSVLGNDMRDLVAAVRETIESPELKRCAGEFRQALARWEGAAERAADAIEQRAARAATRKRQ